MRGRMLPFLVGTALVSAACSSAGVDATPSGTSDDEVVVTTSAPAELDATDAPQRTDTDGTTATDAPVDVAAFEPRPIEWKEFDEQVDVATLEVPVDYGDPDGDAFELFLARYNAIDQENRIGTLLINPGGPGVGGSDFAFFASQIFDQPLLERFDVVGWDPRGTGESDPAIDCIGDYDRFFNEVDSTPDSDEARQLLVDTAREFAEQCTSGNADIIEHIGTNNSARDMDTIRRALDEDTISYFGFSYGSELGAVWATLFPDTVRAAVFDGASDPDADALQYGLAQFRAFEASLDAFVARCSADPGCAFHNDGAAAGALDALLAELDADPLPSDGDRAPVNRDVAVTGIQQALYSESFWPALEQALAAAQDGDGSGLLELSDSYYRRSPDGEFGNELEAFRAISCADTVERKSVEESDAENHLYTEVAPRLVPEGTAGGYFCTFFPDAIDARIPVDAAGAGPIVVIATTGDPATPFDSSVKMSDVLDDGRLVIVEANEHTGYGVNRCVIDVVNDYLIDLDAPADGTACR